MRINMQNTVLAANLATFPFPLLCVIKLCYGINFPADAVPFPTMNNETYKFTNGLDYTIRQLAEYNNVAFQGYLNDMTLSPDMFEAFLVPQHIVHGLSVYMHTANGQLVGFSRTSIRGTRAWVAGVAIVPE